MPIDMQYLMIAFTAKIEYFYYCFVNEQMPSFSEHDIFVFSGVFISIFSCPVLGFFGKMGRHDPYGLETMFEVTMFYILIFIVLLIVMLIKPILEHPLFLLFLMAGFAIAGIQNFALYMTKNREG